MSDTSQLPPGNRPPLGRVFRPFAGGTAEQGSQSPSGAPDSRAMNRRPMPPRRPFVSGQAPQSSAAAAPPTIDLSRAIDVGPGTDVSAATEVPFSAPAWEAPHATVLEPATWLRIVEAEPAVHDFETDLIGENATLGGALETEETSTLRLEPPAIAEENCAPSFVEFESPAIAEENFAPSFVEPTFSANEELPVVTAEVLAIEREELDSSPIAQYVEPDLLDAPLFIAPNSELAADNVIDEVDAAFITAGLRATGAGSPSNDALQAAAALEEVARRLRAGDIDLRRAPTASLSSEESALATVLAALLANR